ncbi:hypothetical protein [Aneurinibacillus terranovensis]
MGVRIKHVLEIGVGTGNLTERLLRKGWNDKPTTKQVCLADGSEKNR